MVYYRFLLGVLLAITAFSSTANTAIYKCVIKGVPTFTQFPCAKNATKVNITLPPTNSPVKDTPTAKNDTSVENYIAIKKIDRQIAQHQLEIKAIKEKLAKRLEVINYMTQDKANRLGANSIQDAINIQSASIKASSQSAIDAEQLQINALEQKKQSLK
ncbi:DUF4124 domain-containing protein [Pseudoalteromonas sp. MMG010]|uniref:DUF4124 domain-containing protein n=1 Tax=Pseudoalteromonas sp. MMG010 TaxID=2822685 RepID=UPI001B3A73C2|nr:DUF4124 domain-containing protein [Pseudoalteromonas sp. MMG010]MBQ4834456.1 DUF4124 domain-containing protein [Pseudoalteromonas sp. MMG010]